VRARIDELLHDHRSQSARMVLRKFLRGAVAYSLRPHQLDATPLRGSLEVGRLHDHVPPPDGRIEPAHARVHHEGARHRHARRVQPLHLLYLGHRPPMVDPAAPRSERAERTRSVDQSGAGACQFGDVVSTVLSGHEEDADPRIDRPDALCDVAKILRRLPAGLQHDHQVTPGLAGPQSLRRSIGPCTNVVRHVAASSHHCTHLVPFRAASQRSAHSGNTFQKQRCITSR
jgi:hypothetical protein